jgi:O-antigen chain-terminating methyltransferase
VANDNGEDKSLVELTEILASIRERVRERHPTPESSGLPLPDLMPLLRARDAAYAKVAAIGSVNPRAGGVFNSIVQFIKRTVARSLNWHVREQVEFNRAVMSSIEAILQALEENNRLVRDVVLKDVNPVRDLNTHWATWRTEWERKLAANETQYLRSLADLQIAFQHRVTMMETTHRDLMRTQHADYLGALDRSTLDIQKRLWDDLQKIRIEYDTLIHTELRLIRQRSATQPTIAPPAVSAPVAASPAFDYFRFSERFRGSEDYVRKGQQPYLEKFQGCQSVLDLGCGRGEFLELMKSGGIEARGIEQSEELVALCRGKGLQADQADLFQHLESQADQTLDGVFCSQVVEHLPPEKLPELIRLLHAKIRRGGVLAVETPNPECLAIFATHFYLDPTHTRPIPPALMTFYFEEFGFGQVEVIRSAQAVDTMPTLAELPEKFREGFFGSLDYAVVGRRI